MVIAVLLAGGKGSRLSSEVAKQHIVVDNRQIIEYTLIAFSNCEEIDKIIVVSNPDYIDEVEELKVRFPKLSKVVSGGSSRSLSVKNGVIAVGMECSDNDKIIISDAARPCVTLKELSGLIEALDDYKAATTGLECYETILKKENEALTQIIPRNGLVRQTSPEAYRYSILKWLYIDATEDIISSYRNIGIDQLFGSGIEIGVVKSNPLNFKITTKDDLQLFESVLLQGFNNIINS